MIAGKNLLVQFFELDNMCQDILKDTFGGVNPTQIGNILGHSHDICSFSDVVVNVLIGAFVGDLGKSGLFRAESFIQVKQLELKL